jgi:hypothetical protein
MGAFSIQSEVPCNFSHLPALIVLSHMVLPLTTIPITFWLIPRAKMTDDLLGAVSPADAANAGYTLAWTKDDADGDDGMLLSGPRALRLTELPLNDDEVSLVDGYSSL